MDKEEMVYIENKTILNLKKDETLPLVITWVDFKGIILSTGSNKLPTLAGAARWCKLRNLKEKWSLI